ncbi:uncharacterized protein LOC144166332 [Haemaphysalis longicornis]
MPACLAFQRAQHWHIHARRLHGVPGAMTRFRGAGVVPAVVSALFRMASGCSTGTHSHRLLRCQQCSYVTPSSSNLKRHRCLHTSECPHQCSHCGKAFVQKFHLAARLHVHTGERPFHCCLFPGSLTQKAGLVADLQSNTVGHSIR